MPGAAAAAGIPTATINNALGEGHLMRGLAYFYLVRLFGNVPIITNPTNDANTFTSVNTNPVTDVYRFIANDMRFAVQNCAPGVANTGHASSNSRPGCSPKSICMSRIMTAQDTLPRWPSTAVSSVW